MSHEFESLHPRQPKRRLLRRPSSAEAHKKVCEALEAVEAGRRIISLEKHLSQAFEFLGISREGELWVFIQQLLKELIQLDPSKHYAGQRPPTRSYDLKGEELWAYAWTSPLLNNKTVYLKFALKKGYFLFVDCHESE